MLKSLVLWYGLNHDNSKHWFERGVVLTFKAQFSQSMSMHAGHAQGFCACWRWEIFFFDPLVLEKFFDGKLRFDEDFQNVEVEVKKNSQKFLGPFSPVELAHWEKSCETWQGDVWTFSLDVMIGPNSWYMVVSPFRPKSSQYTFGCLSPSDWEKGKNWKRLPFSGV